jgi:hypothetical protein
MWRYFYIGKFGQKGPKKAKKGQKDRQTNAKQFQTCV